MEIGGKNLVPVVFIVHIDDPLAAARPGRSVAPADFHKIAAVEVAHERPAVQGLLGVPKSHLRLQQHNQRARTTPLKRPEAGIIGPRRGFPLRLAVIC